MIVVSISVQQLVVRQTGTGSIQILFESYFKLPDIWFGSDLQKIIRWVAFCPEKTCEINLDTIIHPLTGLVYLR